MPAGCRRYQEMAHKDKHKPKAVPETGDRQREIDRLEKDVEELRHMANSPGAEAELEDRKSVV